jgi:two-component system chemotaxis response regulator CheY
MKILVIDDSVAMRRIIRDYLEVLGFDAVVEAHDGESALAAIASQAIDFVITDWAMPSMSGPDLVRAIRSSPTHGRLPVLMVTGIAEQEDIVQAVEAGVDGYIVKPFAPDTLREKMAQVIGKAPTGGGH